ncbi:hypothetical protein I3843_16G026200 [Carya illinoinensis]|uniref:Peptidase S26 domain-containing protein n=2 Tax=Carya illinoinensis TaxID=32201 RepID=A0A8T1N3I1_CARIL|nr:probable signal peptidase I-1 isoform X2 [Carya illinoinensis]KAG6624402.1 hypothetical protein CIPAW_16G024600 [Carya illinoinensis]KAG7941181.1 hypothetical protein I3843_16G026200 [Carya illinoinensis]
MPCQSWGFLRWPGLDGLLRLFVVLLLWSTFSEIRHIPSSSMFPTLRVGDRIIVERASYYFVSPAIHDIVTFRDPTQHPGDEQVVFIKRIVAKAGDSVQVNHGLLYVNGIAQKEDFIAECPTYKSNLTNSIAGLELLGANEFHKTAQRSMMFHAMCLPCHWSSSSCMCLKVMSLSWVTTGTTVLTPIFGAPSPLKAFLEDMLCAVTDQTDD